MNKFEQVMLDILKTAMVGGQIAGPIFVHSAKGVAILNASEETASTLLSTVTTTPTQGQ